MSTQRIRFDIVIVGGGHAGAEAAWTACNLGMRVALITMDASKIGQMSCNPAIGGLAKGQIVREIDAFGGLMGLAADATGIQFRVLNRSKGPAVRGPRCQSDKYQYAREVQRLLKTRPNLTILSGTVDDILVDDDRCTGVVFKASKDQVWNTDPDTDDFPDFGLSDSYPRPDSCGGCSDLGGWAGHEVILEGETLRVGASAVVLTTGTFMRGLMHTGDSQTAGGRVGEKAAVGISGCLTRLGFDLGRLKTGTPPRLAAETIDFDSMTIQPGDDPAEPFSDMTQSKFGEGDPAYDKVRDRFPYLEQRVCWTTHTAEHIHEKIRSNLDRAPMYNGQIETAGPRYCPSIEDKVVRFQDKTSHHVFLEPESLESNEIYCNGISTSLPADVQDYIVRNLPGCENATILKYGYAVEYDMVWPHQIDATCMTKRIPGLFLAGQINGTSGYEEAAGQGLIAGLNAVRFSRGQDLVRLRRDEAYIGVLMDDLVTKTPREPYRMFTSRAEHRLLLRSDNTPERLTPMGRDLGLVDDRRWAMFQDRESRLGGLRDYLQSRSHQGKKLWELLKRPEFDEQATMDLIEDASLKSDVTLVSVLLSDVKYEGFIKRHYQQMEKIAKLEGKTLAADFDYAAVQGLRNEAKITLDKFRPATLGQAGRLAGITPADLTVLAMAVDR